MFHTVDYNTRINKNLGSATDNIFIDNCRVNSFEVSPFINGLSTHDVQYLVLQNVFALNKGSKQISSIKLMTKDTI